MVVDRVAESRLPCILTFRISVPKMLSYVHFAGSVIRTPLQVPQLPESSRLPHYLQRLTDPEASADFPPAKQVSVRDLDNRELDKLMATLGKSNATWRRYLPVFLLLCLLVSQERTVPRLKNQICLRPALHV